MKKKNTLLWEIKGDTIKSPSYVFGTMHVQDERAFRNIEFVENCILNCEAFAAEYDLDTDDAMAFRTAGIFQNEEKLSQLLNPKIYSKLSKLFKKETGQELIHFDNHKPFLIINILTATLFNNDFHLSLDQHLQEFSKENEKIILGIESFETQLEIMNKMDIENHLKSLKDMALHFERFRRNIKKVTTLYLEADLQKLLKNVKKTSGSMRKLLLYDRNENMANRIAELAQANSIFCAIGAGHLAGKKGVLRFLKMKGLSTEPIFY